MIFENFQDGHADMLVLKGGGGAAASWFRENAGRAYLLDRWPVATYGQGSRPPPLPTNQPLA